MIKKGIIIFAAAAAVVISVVGLAYSQEGFLAPERVPAVESTGSPDRPPRPGGAPILRVMKGLIRGEILTETPQGIRRIKIDRGEVESVSENSLKIKERDGKRVNISLSNQTKFKGKARDELKAGDKVGVFRVKKSGKYVTRLIVVINEQMLKRRPGAMQPVPPQRDFNAPAPEQNFEALPFQQDELF